MSNWHNAQVIEATTPLGRRVVTYCGGDLYRLVSGVVVTAAELSDVRVIVDAEGKVAPPQITDEMVAAHDWALVEHDDVSEPPYSCGCGYVPTVDGDSLRTHQSRAALAAALGSAA